MSATQQHLSRPFQDFVDSESAGAILLIIGTVISLLITNSSYGPGYLSMWQVHVGGLSVAHWVNDALMAVFFLLIGLELERELYRGELSDGRNALLPIIAAIGGMVVPALIHFSLNSGTPAVRGIGIPTATDVAFALGIIAILGNRIPASLKVFVVAFAVIDDLSAIVIIAVFYTAQLGMGYLAAALAVWTLLILLNRLFRVMSLIPYLLGGALMWFLMLKSGVHPTVAGVLLAFAIPFSTDKSDEESPSQRLEHLLHRPVALIILPIFALANTGIVVGADWMQHLTNANSIGIAAGLIVGKPIGVTVLCVVAVATGICRLPPGLNWRHIVGAGLLGGVGFTMSTFIANLAFAAQPEVVDSSKMAILLASLIAGTIGFLWLAVLAGPSRRPGRFDPPDR